jgi:hypothetical protein
MLFFAFNPGDKVRAAKRTPSGMVDLMAPEAPGNLVALDVRSDANGFVCRVERYDPTEVSSRFLRVSWNAITRPPGYDPVAGGAAYVEITPGFDHRSYEARPDIAGPRLTWLDKVFGDGLMLIVILPYGYALLSLQDADPPPVAAKVHDGRMAVYWLHPKRTRTTWRMEVVEAERISKLCSALNEEASRLDQRAPMPVDFVNHAAPRHYPPGLRPDEEMMRFHDLCAWIGEQGGDEAQVSFTGVLLTFLVAADPISRWFKTYVSERNIALEDMLSSKGFASLASLEMLASGYTPSTGSMRKKPWTPSAREVLTASDALAQRVGGEGCAVGIRHIMGAYCQFHYPNHEAQLRRWGFDLVDWLSEYRKLLKTTALAPTERAGWHALFKEMGITERGGPRAGVRPTDTTARAAPGGWDIFIAHASADRASAEQLYDRLLAGGHRVFLDARTLTPGDFWDLEIPHALETSRMILVLIASSYESAHYLRDEIANAITQARRTGLPRVIPIYMDGPPPPGKAPYGLSVVQAIDARALGGLGGVADQVERLLA